jgi:hypothetical protein
MPREQAEDVMRVKQHAGLKLLAAGVLAIAAVAALPSAMAASADGSPGNAASPGDSDMPTSLRLSPSQYRLTIGDIFESSIKITGRFEPEMRDQGMLAIGARTANITDSGIQADDEIARSVATQVVDEHHRAELIGCKPRSETQSDDDCARSFFRRVGPSLFRRPLSDEEIEINVKAAGAAADTVHDFYKGLADSLAEMLISPDFLFRYRMMEPDTAHAGQEHMNLYSKASQLSFFLWNTTPDEDLLDAAKSGALNTRAGLEKQVNRLIASPRIADGISALFSDMLGFSDFEAVSKDPTFFPRYTPSIKEEAQDQTLRTIVDHIVNRHADYRDLFTTPHTFLTVDLAALYDVPLVDTTDNGQPQHWIPYTYPAGDPHAGLLSQASFTTLWSPSGRTSPTGRGKALRQNMLCEKVPPPPGNVSFKFVEDTSNPQYKTTRERLMAHRTEPMCAGCHKLTDPIGLALENFDSAGEFRTSENGIAIDASGELNGKQFDGPLGLGRTVHDDPAAVSCVAQRAFAFETGYMPPKDDARWQQIQQRFAASHYDVLELLRAIALSDLSYGPEEQPKALSAANH